MPTTVASAASDSPTTTKTVEPSSVVPVTITGLAASVASIMSSVVTESINGAAAGVASVATVNGVAAPSGNTPNAKGASVKSIATVPAATEDARSAPLNVNVA